MILIFGGPRRPLSAECRFFLQSLADLVAADEIEAPQKSGSFRAAIGANPTQWRCWRLWAYGCSDSRDVAKAKHVLMR
jgi:hypothetical protein